MQSKTQSMLESFLNVLSDFFLSLAIWILLIVPVFNLTVTFSDNLSITAIFTVVSIVRGYLWRRLFNYLHHQGTFFRQ